MNMETEEIGRLSEIFLKKNYDYIWLKTMLEKGKGFSDYANGTLITGSSHALNGIKENFWDNALNCSMHSQDLYYDFKCAREVMEGKARFKKCLIIFGYYIAFQDLSLSEGMRNYIVSPVYYPIFGDGHNWASPMSRNLWKDFTGISDEVMRECERYSQQIVYEKSTYYSELKNRKPFFDFHGCSWRELTFEDQEKYARQRAEGHNSVLKYTSTFYENRNILKDYVHFLHLNYVMPIVVIPPFSSAYNRYIDERLKLAVTEMIGSLEETVYFVDFNEKSVFDEYDFIDTDHLNERGAIKLSKMLTDKFGK